MCLHFLSDSSYHWGFYADAYCFWLFYWNASQWTKQLIFVCFNWQWYSQRITIVMKKTLAASRKTQALVKRLPNVSHFEMHADTAGFAVVRGFGAEDVMKSWKVHLLSACVVSFDCDQRSVWVFSCSLMKLWQILRRIVQRWIVLLCRLEFDKGRYFGWYFLESLSAGNACYSFVGAVFSSICNVRIPLSNSCIFLHFFQANPTSAIYR